MPVILSTLFSVPKRKRVPSRNEAKTKSPSNYSDTEMAAVFQKFTGKT